MQKLWILSHIKAEVDQLAELRTGRKTDSESSFSVDDEEYKVHAQEEKELAKKQAVDIKIEREKKMKEQNEQEIKLRSNEVEGL